MGHANKTSLIQKLWLRDRWTSAMEATFSQYWLLWLKCNLWHSTTTESYRWSHTSFFQFWQSTLKTFFLSFFLTFYVMMPQSQMKNGSVVNPHVVPGCSLAPACSFTARVRRHADGPTTQINIPEEAHDCCTWQKEAKRAVEGRPQSKMGNRFQITTSTLDHSFPNFSHDRLSVVGWQNEWLTTFTICFYH